MNIILGKYPPNINDIRKVLTVPETAIFTYGSDLYIPSNGRIDEPLFKHEQVHERQQNKMGVKQWWKRYISDLNFRLSQEIEAHQVQYREAKKLIKDRNRLSLYGLRLASSLASEQYGNIISQQDAYNAIRSEITYSFDT